LLQVTTGIAEILTENPHPTHAKDIVVEIHYRVELELE
jgi:hypothetical protein